MRSVWCFKHVNLNKRRARWWTSCNSLVFYSTCFHITGYDLYYNTFSCILAKTVHCRYIIAGIYLLSVENKRKEGGAKCRTPMNSFRTSSLPIAHQSCKRSSSSLQSDSIWAFINPYKSTPTRRYTSSHSYLLIAYNNIIMSQVKMWIFTSVPAGVRVFQTYFSRRMIVGFRLYLYK